jgi:hypothetical protein
MDQNKRIEKITQIIEAGRMRALRRNDFDGVQIGIPVKEDVTMWGRLPKDETADRAFAEDLLVQAKKEASRP